MDVLSSIVAVFIEMLGTVIAVAAFGMLIKAYLARKNAFLLWFSASSATLAIGLAALFLGQVFSAYGHDVTSLQALKLAMMFASLKGFFDIVGLCDLYARKRSALLCLAVGIVLLAVGTATVLMAPHIPVVVAGMAFLRFEPPYFVAIFGTWVAATLILVWFPGSRIIADMKAKREASTTDRTLFNAGLFGLLFILITIVSITLEARFLLVPVLTVLLAHISLLGIGILASQHPDPVVRKKPFTIFTSSLVIKAVGINAIILWLLALGLLVVTSSYFVSSSIESRRASLRRDLHYFTKSYSSYSLTLLEETARFAALPAVITSLADEEAPRAATMEDIVSDFMKKRRGSRILRVIDPSGLIIFSSYSSDEHGKYMASSRVLEKALAGKMLAAIEREEAFGIWTVRAGAPIVRDDGTTVGVILDTDIEAAFDFTDYAAISPIYAAGYGFVSEGDEQVYTYGQGIDALTRLTLRKHLGSGNLGSYETDTARYLIERVYATDGVPNGFFYIYLTDLMLDAEVFRIISVVTLLVVLSVVFMTGILLFGMTIVLRPILELRAAAISMEKEEGVRIVYKSADELGKLAEAFNHMQTTIVVRTSALKEALRQQQDFLDHTTRELRTPLNIFRWTLELMRFGDTGRLNKEQLELIEQLNQTNERLIKMVKNLQDAIRIDQRRLALKIQDVIIEDVIDEVAGILAVSSRKKGLALHWNRPKTSLPLVYADRAYLQTVLMNLMGNAVKYTPQNGHIEVDVTEAHEASPGGKRGKFIRVTVEDNGIGIPNDEAGRVFSRFFRAKNAIWGEIEGTGLGLFITKQIVELHGGAIWIESREGVGTTVSFTMPCEKPAALSSPKDDGQRSTI